MALVPASSHADSSSGGSTELAYVERTTSQTVTGSEISPTDIVSSGAVTYAAARILIEFYSPAVTVGSGSSSCIVTLWDGASNLGWFALSGQTSASQVSAAMYAKRYLTPSAGSHTYKVRAWPGVGTALIDAGAWGSGTYPPMFIRVSLA
jgi:hypothetical protein